MRSVTDIATETIRAHSLLPESAPLLLMVSGGGDSVAMLHLAAKGAFGSRPLRALHVNHLLRGEESDADEEFCVRLCARLGIESESVRYDVGAYARRESLNLEDAGRTVRYRFADEALDAWCEQLGAGPPVGRVATAHTVDDRIETLLTRLASGCGTGALSSIARARGRIVRPLLDCERAGLRAWLESMGEPWREDSSNSDTARARALVRAEVLPGLERLNPGFRTAMARTMDLAGDDDRVLARLAFGFARDFAAVRPGEVRFEREWMRTLDRAMARRTVRTAVIEAFPEASRLEAAHVEAIVDGLSVDGFSRDLPGGLRVSGEYATLVISRSGTSERRVAPALLPLPGHAVLGDAGEMLALDADAADVSGGGDSIVIDAGVVDGDALTVDSWSKGDRMRPLGMSGTKKVSDLFVDAKVPRGKRATVPVVRDGTRIVWVAGLRMSEEYRVTAETTRALRLEWKRPGVEPMGSE